MPTYNITAAVSLNASGVSHPGYDWKIYVPEGPYGSPAEVLIADSNTTPVHWTVGGTPGSGYLDLTVDYALHYNVQYDVKYYESDGYGTYNEYVGTFPDWYMWAQYSSQSVSLSMTAGSTQSVSITYQNQGQAFWNTQAEDGTYYVFLYSQSTAGNTRWGMDSVALPNIVGPWEYVTFTWTITAPATPGTYKFKWRPVLANVGEFGQYSIEVDIVVSAAPAAGRRGRFLAAALLAK